VNELVIALVEAGSCLMCGDELRMRIRRVASPEAAGGLVGWIACPLCSGAESLTVWLAPYLEFETPPEGGAA
jgi:hypothetical protein